MSEKNCIMRNFVVVCALPVLLLMSGLVGAPGPIELNVDARQAPRKIFHVQMKIPGVSGRQTLYFVKWIPGEHSPSGQVVNLVDLKMSASGQTVPWQRDPEDMFTFHLTVPAGSSELEVDFDYLSPVDAFDFQGGVSATPNLAIVNWNQVLLYPAGRAADDIQFKATLQIPDGWSLGTALPVSERSANRISFSTASLTTLVDSPVILGKYYRQIDLTPGKSPAHLVDIVAESRPALEPAPAAVDHLKRLVDEADRLFQSHHFRDYHFLLTLSDRIAHIAQEHHESSDDRFNEMAFQDPDQLLLNADVLPHEFVHSWNGKFRRPSGLANPDYQVPMKDNLLWVYEGLTQYLGGVLAARSGGWSEQQFREDLAYTAAMLDHQVGRTWRSLADTAISAQLLYFAPPAWASRRRATDFYPEGRLLWLEVDLILRQESGGTRSLDDFCRTFYSGGSGAPQVIPYSLTDLVQALNRIVPYDWNRFFRERLSSTSPQSPHGGIRRAGWKLIYTQRKPELIQAQERVFGLQDLRYSMGLLLHSEDGKIVDVIPQSAVDQAGLYPGLQLVAVNGRQYDPRRLEADIQASAKSSQPLELLVRDDQFFKTIEVGYHQGLRYPYLKRQEGNPDILASITRPLAPSRRRR